MKAFTQQNSVSNLVMRPLSFFVVAASIDLHDEPAIETDEIKKVSAKWRLPSEVIAVGSQGAQM